jgi:hypothetical protein
MVSAGWISGKNGQLHGSPHLQVLKALPKTHMALAISIYDLGVTEVRVLCQQVGPPQKQDIDTLTYLWPFHSIRGV